MVLKTREGDDLMIPTRLVWQVLDISPSIFCLQSALFV